MGVAALVLGILALIFCWVPVFGNIAALVLGLIGLILAIIALRREEKKGVAIAGLVLSIVALVIAIVMIFLIGVGIGAVMSDPALQRQIQEQAQDLVNALESAAPTVSP